MKLTFELVNSKDPWEHFLLTYSPQSLFQSWQWGEVQKKSGEIVYRLGLYDGKELAGIAQVTLVRAKRGTFLHIRHGPIWKTQTYWTEFVKIIVSMAKKERAWFVRVSPLIAPTPANKQMLASFGFIPSPIHEVDAERCWVLDLDKSEEELLMGMRKTTRYEIRLAQKSGVSVYQSRNRNDLKHFLTLYEATSARQKFVGHSAITEEFEVFSAQNESLLFLGSYKKEVKAAAIVLFYGNQAIYHHGASLPGRVPVSHLVQWEAIREAKKRGKNVYNFYGIAPENRPKHPWRGITVFKKGFGGQEINYLHSHDLPVSPLYIIPSTIEKIRTYTRGY